MALTDDAFQMINMACEVYTVMLMVALILSMSWGVRSRKRTLLLGGMWTHLCAVSSDLVANLCDGRTGAHLHALAHVSNVAAYVAGILTCVMTIAYMCTDANGELIRDERADAIVRLLLVLNGIHMLLVLTNPWTGAYYVITPDNQFVWGPLCTLADVIDLIQVAFMVPVVLWHRARHGTRTAARLVACDALVALGVLSNVVSLELALLYPAIALSFLLLSVGVQTNLEEELVQARAESAESRVRLLSGQVRPHFVFNSLAAIKALVSENPARAETAIQDFSDYLRSHLDVMSTSRLVPFDQEMEHVRHYVSLELTDATTPLEVHYDLAVTDFLVPPLTVQPLVENAIRHGIKTREEGGTVVVATRRTDGAVQVEVRDDGCGFSSATERQSEHRQVGMENVRERVERQCAGTLEVRSDASGTVATLTIPEGA